jgi:serine/threonine protein phosphatase PrpC
MNASSPTFEAATITLCGSRACNQDRALLLNNGDTVLLAVADGLGGHPRGEVAAQLLIDVCEAQFRRASGPLPDPEHFMLQCIGRAHHAILRFGLRQAPPIAPRTTAVLAVIQGGIAHWTHVGDSRLYLIRDGQILAQTRDHSLIRFVRRHDGESSRPRASLTRCLGGLPQPPTTTCGPPTLLQTGDSIVLCSDGLWGQLPRQRLLEAFEHGATAVEARLQALAEQAATAPNSDNVTAVALRWLATPAVMTEQSGLLELPEDPLLDQAIQHLQSVLEKTTKPKP